MPTAPTGITSEAQRSQIDNFPAGYVYSHTSHTCAEFLKVDAYAQDSQYDADFNPDMLTDEGISTGQYAICQVVMQLTSILKMRAAYWANLQVITSIDRTAPDFGDDYYLQLVDTVMYILQDIFICIIKEQCSDQAESKWKR